MKKILLTLCLFAGIATTSMADTMCRQTMNVEPTMRVYAGNLLVKCKNYNNYKVTVVITASINGECERQSTIVVEGGNEKEANLGKCNSDAVESKCGVSLSVWKCD